MTRSGTVFQSIGRPMLFLTSSVGSIIIEKSGVSVVILVLAREKQLNKNTNVIRPAFSSNRKDNPIP